MLRHACFAALTAAGLGVGGCSGDSAISPGRRTDEPFPPSATFLGLVTDPAPSSTAGLAATPDAEVVYVSMPRGAMQTGVSVVVTNHRTKRSASAELLAGGFDPVPIGARVADTIVVTVRLTGGGTERTWATVPHTRRPEVVRIEPGLADHDVPLDASMLVVFSEPIDATSGIEPLIELKRDAELVPGTADLVGQRPWLVRFIPAAQLERDASYELIAPDVARDLDGDRLESPRRVTFKTADPGAGRLAFSSWTGSVSMVYTMRPDGSALALIAEGIDPSFSPDGQRIAFWRYEDGVGGIYVSNANGSDVRKVASEGHHPTWSPDGGKLAYGCGGICIINVDGTGLTRLTPPARTSKTPTVCVRDTDPAWSPDGSTIAFTRWPDKLIPTAMCVSLGIATSFPFDFWTEVWFVDVGGTNPRPLRDLDGTIVTYAGWPAWSPDGKYLAFYRANVFESIDVASADGSKIVTVMRRSPPQWDNVLGSPAWSPAWSPDGRRIVFGTPAGWGFADASGSGDADLVTSRGFVPNSLSWAWSSR